MDISKILTIALIVFGISLIIGLIIVMIITKVRYPKIKTAKTSSTGVRDIKDLEGFREMFRHKQENYDQQVESSVVDKANLPRLAVTNDDIQGDSEISKGTLESRITPTALQGSKYTLDVKATKSKKIDRRKIKKAIKNMSPNMQAILMMNIMRKK